MTECQILINNKSKILNLDTNSPVSINWAKLELEQELIRLTITNNNQLIFDSELIRSSKPFLTFNLPPSGQREKYQLKLDITTKLGERKKFEKTFFSSNGNLHKADWITRLDNPIEKEGQYFDDKRNMIFEKNFDYQKSDKEVFLDICGLGYYTVKINDLRIDDTFLNNDVSNYSKIVYYDTYDIRPFLKEGENQISVELANGWYNPAPIKLLGKYNVRNRLSIGKTCLICQISYMDKYRKEVIINSDTSWNSKNGNYLFNNLFIGERLVSSSNVYNGQDSVNNQTVRISGPGGVLIPSNIKKIKRVQNFEPKNVQMTDEGILIDFGRMISGQFSCTLSKVVKGKITILYSESIDKMNHLDNQSCISGVYGIQNHALGIEENTLVLQADEILKDNKEFNFANQYVYHSFRYAVIQCENICLKDVENIQAYGVYTDLEVTSHFESSNEQFNLLWEAARETKRNNIHSIFEDCPRERLGYGGDIVALIDSQLNTFDIEQLLIKVFKDFINDQTVAGGIPQTAPFIGIQTNGPSDRAGSLGWQLVVPTIANKIQQHYNQPYFFENHMKELVAHVQYLLSFDYEYIQQCCLADWGSIDTEVMKTPDRDFCSAMMYYLIIKKYSELFKGKLLEKELNDKLSEIKSKIMNEFYEEEGYFQTGSQSSFAFALISDILSSDLREKVMTRFIEKIEKDKGILRTGIFGMPWTFRILSEAGRDDITNDWFNRKEYPSFFNMLSKGGEVLREHFKVQQNTRNMGSLNHAMFTSYSTWMIEKILGIQILDQAIAYNQIRINPYFPEDMTHANGYLETSRGTITSRWKRVNCAIEMTLEIPKGIKFDLQINQSYKYETIQKDSAFYSVLELTIMDRVTD